MRVHTIDLQPKANRGPGMYESPQVYQCRSKHQGGRLTRFAISYISAECEQGGSLVTGPHAYGTALAGAIAGIGSTGAESARRRAHGLEFDAEVGDFFVIDDELFELREDRRLSDPRFVHIPMAARVLSDLTADDAGKRFLCEAALVIDGQPIAWAGVISGVEHRPESRRLDPTGCTIVEVEHPGNNLSFWQHASTPIRVEL